jgi:hypothetical protein
MTHRSQIIPKYLPMTRKLKCMPGNVQKLSKNKCRISSKDTLNSKKTWTYYFKM